VNLIDSRILITGAGGMVGASLARHFRAAGARHLHTPSRTELDCRDRARVFDYLGDLRPEVLFMCAARVGGIAANMADPAGFLTDNLHIELNLLEGAATHRIGTTVFIGSSCIYPRDCAQPMREDALLTGPLEPTNEGYALAKIAGLRLAQYIHRQHGLRMLNPMPSNIYGTGDHFDLQRSHVLSALVRRFCDAVDTNRDTVTLWGTGVARREFIHVDDVVRALLLLLDTYQSPEIINVGTGTDVSIAELATMIADATGFRGRIEWDATKPDGMPRKCMDVSRLRALGFEPAIDLASGIARTITEFRSLGIEASA